MMIMATAETPLAPIPARRPSMAPQVDLKAGFSLVWRISSKISNAMNPPKKKPISVPKPNKRGDNVAAPMMLPAADVHTPDGEKFNLAAPVMTKTKSRISTNSDIANRIRITFNPICSNPVRTAYRTTSSTITAVPGRPYVVMNKPKNKMKIKMVDPAISSEVKLLCPLFFRWNNSFERQNDGACNEYSRVDTCHRTDQHGKNKTMNDCTAEEEKSS